MGTLFKRQQRALAKAKKVLSEAEKARCYEVIDQSLKGFSPERKDLLLDTQFVENLGPYLHEMYRTDRRSEVLALMIIFEEMVVDEEVSIRENSVFILSKFSSSVIDSNDLEILSILLLLLTRWLEVETDHTKVFGVGCSQLHKIGHRLLEDQKYWQEASLLTVVLKFIQDDEIVKSEEIHSMILKLQESLATKDVLGRLVTSYLKNKTESRNQARKILTTLGRRSTIYLVNQLMHSTDKNVRLTLVKLIPGAGRSIVPILEECLQSKPPWFVIRNIIFIISELADESLYDIVEPYLSHKDIRVQQQVLSCLVKISEDTLTSRLIASLKTVHDDLKIQIIIQLGQPSDNMLLVRELTDLLDTLKNFDDKTSIDLAIKVCVALRSSHQKQVIDKMTELIEKRRELNDLADPILLAAQETLSVVEPRYRHSTQEASLGTDQTQMGGAYTDDPDAPHSSIENIEKSVEEYLAQGDVEKAGVKLFSNAVNAARKKDFTSAELLRDTLLEINPLALTEVIRLGEIIDEEKSSTINNNHLEVWSELYDRMNTEEFSALYHALRQGSYFSGETIIKAGENDPSLYFVNSGSVTLSCTTGTKESFLKRLQPGEVIGVGPFFSVSVWTVSMTAETDSQLHVLSRKQFLELKNHYPELERKLETYCDNHDTVPELLKMSGSDRRESARYSITVKVRNILLDPYGNIGNRAFRGELIDISKGGLCFSINISSKKNARLLLGRQIITEITLGDGNILKCFGAIVGVKFHENEIQEFSVHVKFYRNLEQVDFKQVINLEI